MGALKGLVLSAGVVTGAAYIVGWLATPATTASSPSNVSTTPVISDVSAAKLAAARNEVLRQIYGPLDGHYVPMRQIKYGEKLSDPMYQVVLSTKQVICGAGSSETTARLEFALPGIESRLKQRFGLTETEAVDENKIIYNLDLKTIRSMSCSMVDTSVGPVARRAMQYPYAPPQGH